MGTKEFIRFILGIIVIVNGVLLSSYYLVISEPIHCCIKGSFS